MGHAPMDILLLLECICNLFSNCHGRYLIAFCTQRERYVVTYDPVKNKVCALLKDQAKAEDIIKAAFHVSDLQLFFFFLLLRYLILLE